MISNFFSQSKPIHYIVVSVLLLLIFVLTRLDVLDANPSFISISKQMGLFFVALLSVFVFDFFVSRNNLTKKNSYNIVLFVLFFSILPQAIINSEIVFANFFVLLALRRIISLRTQKDTKKKLFDAAFWIALATIFFFWSSVFLVLIFAALLIYGITDVKNYVIPLIGIATVAIILVSYLIIVDIDILQFAERRFGFSFDFSNLNSKQIIIGATLLLSFGLWSLFYYIKNLKSQMKSYRPSFTIVILTAILSLLIVVVSPSKNGSEFIFMFAPLSIIITNYLEVVTEKWFKEILLWVLVLTPIGLLLL